LAAKYILGNSQLPNMVSKLSIPTKNVAASLISDPHKIENVIGMVRTFAPLASPQTVSKVNTYLPLAEKTSTLLGMYSFLNRAQTFRPLEPLNANTPAEKLSALMKSGNIPVAKLAQPLIANNMDKIMGGMAKNMLKNGNLGDILSAFANQQTGSKSDGNGGFDLNNLDLNSLMETFMPIINSMSNQEEKEPEKQAEKSSEIKTEIHTKTPRQDVHAPKKTITPSVIFNEASLPDYDQEVLPDHEYIDDQQENNMINHDVSLHEEINDQSQRENHTPIKIRHKRRR
jgi:hypothetical protein